MENSLLATARLREEDVDYTLFAQPQMKPLDPETTVEILKNVDLYKSTHVLPKNPKAGDVFLFLPTSDEEKGNWKKDSYTWVNHGPKALPSKDPVVQKRYYVAKMADNRPSKFHKNVYMILNDLRPMKPCIVQYLGDMEGISLHPRKRGQSQGGTQDEIETSQVVTRTPRPPKTYLAPTQQEMRKTPVSKEDFRKMHDIAYNVDDFAHYIRLSPTFVCVVGIKCISDELDRILQTHIENEPVILSYSNTYELRENLMMSALLYSHTAFTGQPSIPSHFVIYEKGNEQDAHLQLFRVASELVPTLKCCESPVVTESDEAKEAAIKECFPDIILLTSWKNVISNTKEWLYGKGASHDEVVAGVEDMRRLWSNATRDDYEKALDEFRDTWSEVFMDYYLTKINPLVKEKLGRWILEPRGVYNPYTGVTDKGSDTLDIIVQQLREWENVTVTATISAIYLLQIYACREIREGACGRGPWNLRDAFLDLQPEMSKLGQEMAFVCVPHNAVHYVKTGRVTIQGGTIVEQIDEDPRQILLSKAKRILESGGIKLNNTMHSFLVNDSEKPGEVVQLKLYPRAACSCSTSLFCQHIIACKMSIGIDMESELERLNTHYINRALKSCENGKDTKRKRRKRKSMDIMHLPLQGIPQKGFESKTQKLDQNGSSEEEQDGDRESDEENNEQAVDTSQMDFFNEGGQVALFP